MKTTLDLPADLLRTVKIRAVQENRRLKDMVAELLRRGLAQPDSGADEPARRVSFPLVRTSAAADGQDLTPDGLAALLSAEDAAAHQP